MNRKAPPARLSLPLVLITLLLSVAPPPAWATTDEEHPPIAVNWQAGDPVRLDELSAGELMWESDDGLIALPVIETRVLLEVHGVMLSGRLTQRFRNPGEEVIEVVYVFPLPQGATVNKMEMVIGARRIVSRVQEKAEARRTYETARAEGRKAALASENRQKLFSIRAANINPGDEIDVELSFVQEVELDDGVYGVRFPMTFTPRYDGPQDNWVGGMLKHNELDDSEAASFVSSKNPSAPQVSMEVRLDTGFELEVVDSSSHEVGVHWEGETWVITPKDGALPADRDFLLSWKPLDGTDAEASFLAERHEDGLYGLLMVIPPRNDSPAEYGLATETVFVVDISGSMQGRSIRQAREALAAALRRLHPGDSFNIIVFNDEQRIYSGAFLPATPGEIDAATDWAGGLEADGGTEILPALRLAVQLARGDTHAAARRIIFLTDGAVSHERAVFDEVTGSLGDVRLHTIGIGSAPNAWLMRKMAAFGRGRSTFIDGVESADNEIDEFLARIERPVMQDLRVEFDGQAPLESWPARLPDLYPGDPVVVSFLFPPGASPGRAVLHGRLAGRNLRLDLPIAELGDATASNSGLATRWARAKIDSLLDSLHEGADEQAVRASVTDLGKRFHMITRYTSLVAVELFPTAFEEGRSLRAPNVLPAGMPMLMLPRGGTLGPLMMLAGLLLAGGGGLLLLLPAYFECRSSATKLVPTSDSSRKRALASC